MKLKIGRRITGALLCVALCITTLPACAANPEDSPVVGKNDGVFQQNMTVPATTPLEEQIQYTETFTSTDGTAEYQILFDQDLLSDPLPIVEVVPRIFTGGDLQRIAGVLFPEAEFYEREPEDNPRYSKSQLQKRMNWMTEIADEEAMRSLWGTELSDYTDQIELLKILLLQYTAQLETAPEENPHTVCNWTFKNDRAYASEFNSTGDPTLFATVDLGPVNYKIHSVVRDKSDYKLNRVTVQFGDGLGYNEQEMRYYQAKLCRTAEPTQAQVDALTEKAQSMLDRMGMGQWRVSRVTVETEIYGDAREYLVKMDAVPVFQGIPALYGQTIPYLTSDVANANYFISATQFHFSANGDLIYFCMDAPVEVSSLINEAAATLPVEELLTLAKNHLSLYGVSEQKYAGLIWSWYPNPLTCKVRIRRLEFGLARLNVANKDFAYYYAPAFAVYGSVDYYDAETGEHIEFPAPPDVEEEHPILWLNAVDGSVL